MIIIFWLGLILLALSTLAVAGILADPELAASQGKAAIRGVVDRLDRWEPLARGLDWLERYAHLSAFLLLVLVDGEAATR